MDGGRVRLQSRSGRDVTTMFPELAHMGEHLGMHALVLDGEVVAFGEDGRPSFARLQNRLHLADPKEARRRAAADPVQFVAFDVLYADGRSLLADPYDARRARLEELGFSGTNFTTTECFRDVSGRDVLRAVTENGLEGVVAKRRDSTYRPGRRVAEWVKVKVVTTQEVVVGGWTEGRAAEGPAWVPSCSASPARTDSTTSARSAPGSTTGPSSRSWSSCRRCARGAIRSAAPSRQPRPRGRTSSVPSLVGEVAYGEWTPAGRLRHPTWRGLRPDKTPADVSRESETSADEPVTTGPRPRW